MQSVTPSPRPRAALYSRVSSCGQKENGSLEEQEARCRAWCADHGYIVIEPPYREVYSGEDIDRPMLELLRDEVRAGRVDVIVADKVDRFSRADPAITAYIIVEAEHHGAKVEFVEVQDDSFEGQALSAVLAIVARVEHKRIQERIAGGKRRRVLGDPAKGKPARLLPVLLTLSPDGQHRGLAWRTHRDCPWRCPCIGYTICTAIRPDL